MIKHAAIGREHLAADGGALVFRLDEGVSARTHRGA